MGFEWLPIKNYKRHFICIHCHKGFKRASKEDLKQPNTINIYTLMESYYASQTTQGIISFIQQAHQKALTPCPQCKQPMQEVPYTFEVPPKKDVKAWKALQNTAQKSPQPNFEAYIQWHQMQLQKEPQNDKKHALLKSNTNKLIALINTSNQTKDK